MSKTHAAKRTPPPVAAPVSPVEVVPQDVSVKPSAHPLTTVGWALFGLFALVALGTYGREDKSALVPIGVGAGIGLGLVVIGVLLGRLRRRRALTGG